MTLLSRVGVAAELVQIEELEVNWEKEKEKRIGAAEWP